MHKKYIFTFLLFSIAFSFGYAQERILYNQIDTTQLTITIYNPPTLLATKKYPAMVFFFGGGWNSGSIAQFEPHAMYFSQRGMICILADYRVKSRHQTTPFE